MAAKVIDLRSDTMTKPTPEMRQAIFEAEVGDDVWKEDVTTNKLEKIAAEMFGKEAALFVPSGTMGNLISIMAHSWGRGLEILVGDKSHIFIHEQGGAAQFGGVHSRSLETKPDGTFNLEEIKQKIRPKDNCHYPLTALICLENTHNLCGGIALPLSYLQQVSSLAKIHDISVHMDGARIFNAATKLNVEVTEIAKYCDSISCCLSKGLGSPVGSVIVGTSEFIGRALRLRKALGGGMRQSGILAAAGILSLTKMTKRLHEDHSNAAKIAKAVAAMKNKAVSIDLNRVETNILIFNIDNNIILADKFCEKLKMTTPAESISVLVSPISSSLVRAVLHCDISESDVDLAIKKFQGVIQNIV